MSFSLDRKKKYSLATLFGIFTISDNPHPHPHFFQTLFQPPWNPCENQAECIIHFCSCTPSLTWNFFVFILKKSRNIYGLMDKNILTNYEYIVETKYIILLVHNIKRTSLIIISSKDFTIKKGKRMDINLKLILPKNLANLEWSPLLLLVK